MARDLSPELEDKFQRMTARHKRSPADFGLVMPESELRQCFSGRRLLAAIKAQEGLDDRFNQIAKTIGHAAREHLDNEIRRLMT